jgi:hypothetical protein
MRTDAAIVKDLKLLPLKGLTLVRNSLRILLSRKVSRCVAAIAKGLVAGLPSQLVQCSTLVST